MGETSNIEIVLPDSAVNNGELIIRQGQAAPVTQPSDVILDGTIEAPGEFIKKRKALIDLDRAIIEVNRKAGKIVFDSDPSYKFHAVVAGHISQNVDLEKFNINRNKLYSRKELVNLLRMNRIFFESREEHSKLISQLSDLNFSQNVDGNIADDRRGNAKIAIDKKTNINVEISFKLKIPIYAGFEPSVFRVEILLDVTDSEAKFWLESVELEELKERIKNEAIDKELQTMKEFVIIETYAS